MPHTVSITEARDNFPALVRQVVEQAEPVIVTSRSRPSVVLLPWTTYQQNQRFQVEGAEHRLQQLVTEMEQTAAALCEGSQPDTLDWTQGLDELAMLASEAWRICRMLDNPARRHLSSLLSDTLVNNVEQDSRLTPQQLSLFLGVLSSLRQRDLTNEAVIQADLLLAEAGLSSIFPISDGLAAQYQPADEEQE
jgi:prevent-host-death family protein